MKRKLKKALLIDYLKKGGRLFYDITSYPVSMIVKEHFDWIMFKDIYKIEYFSIYKKFRR